MTSTFVSSLAPGVAPPNEPAFTIYFEGGWLAIDGDQRRGRPAPPPPAVRRDSANRGGVTRARGVTATPPASLV